MASDFGAQKAAYLGAAPAGMSLAEVLQRDPFISLPTPAPSSSSSVSSYFPTGCRFVRPVVYHRALELATAACRGLQEGCHRHALVLGPPAEILARGSVRGVAHFRNPELHGLSVLRPSAAGVVRQRMTTDAMTVVDGNTGLIHASGFFLHPADDVLLGGSVEAPLALSRAVECICFFITPGAVVECMDGEMRELDLEEPEVDARLKAELAGIWRGRRFQVERAYFDWDAFSTTIIDNTVEAFKYVIDDQLQQALDLLWTIITKTGWENFKHFDNCFDVLIDSEAKLYRFYDTINSYINSDPNVGMSIAASLGIKTAEDRWAAIRFIYENRVVLANFKEILEEYEQPFAEHSGRYKRRGGYKKGLMTPTDEEILAHFSPADLRAYIEVIEGWIPDCVARIVARIQAVGLVENETTRATDLAGFFDCRMQALDGYGTAAPAHEAAYNAQLFGMRAPSTVPHLRVPRSHLGFYRHEFAMVPSGTARVPEI